MNVTLHMWVRLISNECHSTCVSWVLHFDLVMNVTQQAWVGLISNECHSTCVSWANLCENI